MIGQFIIILKLITQVYGSVDTYFLFCTQFKECPVNSCTNDYKL